MVFAIFYNAFDAIAGISTGILARAAGEDQLGDQAAMAAIETLFHDPVKNLLGDIGVYAWILALVAAAVALYRAGSPRRSFSPHFGPSYRPDPPSEGCSDTFSDSFISSTNSATPVWRLALESIFTSMRLR